MEEKNIESLVGEISAVHQKMKELSGEYGELIREVERGIAEDFLKKVNQLVDTETRKKNVNRLP